MRSARVLSVVGVASLLAAIGCSSNEASELGSTSQALLTEPLLNEVLFNPPGTDNPYEYVEIKGPPGKDLTGYSVAYLESDNNTNLGKATVVWSLTGSIGSNGLYLVRAATGHAGVPAETGVQSEANLASAGQLQNDSGTVILVKGGTLSTTVSYNNAGVLALPSGVTLLDSVSITDGGATDVAFGPLVRAASGTPDAVSRFLGDDNVNSVDAWYGGDINGAAPTDLAYSATACTAVMPENAAITPGAPNLPRPLVVDGGAVVDAGSTPVDSGSTPVDAGSTPVDAGSTPVDAGSTPVDAGSTQDASVTVDSGTPAVDAGSVQDASTSVDAGAPVVDGGSVQDAGTSVDASFPPAPSDPYLNEILINPPDADNPYEYIELKGAPGASLAAYQLVYVDGDSTQIGTVKKVWSLAGSSVGTNGFFVLKAPVGTGHAVPSGCNVQGEASFGTASSIENGSGTILLVRGGALALSDYDANNDGVLELPAGVVVVDSVATTDGGSGDAAHGPLVTLVNGQPDALSRIVGSTLRSDAAAWYGGDVIGTNASLDYDPAKVTANMPAGATLTPGAENSQGAPATPDAGAPIVDAGSPVVDAGPRDAGTPVVDAGARDAGSPVVDAGTRDAGTPPADAGTRDAGTPPTDAGARDAGAPPAEQTFGEDEGGCGCAVVGSPRASTQPLAWVALGGFAILVARRRRR